MNQVDSKNYSSRHLSSIKNLPSCYPGAGFTEQSIRWWVFNSKENGLEGCIIRIGRKILIDLDKFEQWLDKKAAA